jgi:hypothetical protein
MKWTTMMAATLAMAAVGASAQTQQTGRSGSGSGGAASRRSGPMTINQASGGGVPHGPRTVRQPTIRPSHPSAGTARRAYGAGTHATTSKRMSGVGKGPQRPAGSKGR